MKCSRCGNNLIPKQLQGISVDECSSCHAVWFDPGELETFRMSIEGGESPEILLPNFQPNSDLKPDACPRCETRTLQVGSLGLHALRVCSGCSGFLVHRDALEELSKSGRRRSAEAAGEVATNAAVDLALWGPDEFWDWIGSLFDGF